MVDYSIDLYVEGLAVCPECNYSWTAAVPYDQFFTLVCQHCGGLVGELQNARVVVV